jgi:TolB-like protein/DNA-binding winged helix-turn-helix (wHTH) protein
MSRKADEKDTNSGESIRIGGFYFDRSSQVLKDSRGSCVRLRPQSAEVLAVLARTPGDIIPKQKLIDEVWPGIATTDDSLVQCVVDIRRVLGREAVETFARRGYRLRTGEKPAAGRSGRRGAILGGSVAVTLLVALALVGISSFSKRSITTESTELSNVVDLNSSKSLAVLPFVGLGNETRAQYFSDGLSEDLATDLSKEPGLTVISPGSSFHYRDEYSGFEDIARELGVHYLVRGTVRRFGARIRINVALVDTATETNVWAERFDRTDNDVFLLQDEVTKAIVGALSVKLASRAEEPRSVNPDAYDLLLHGLASLRRFTAEGNREARRYFERAVAFDPNYARAYANIALTYGREVVFRFDDDPGDGVRKGLAAARTAVELDDTIPQTQFALGVLNLAERHYDAAIIAARSAVALDHSYADAYALLGNVSAYGGDLREGLRAIRNAKRLNPHFPFSYLWVEGHILYLQGRYSEAWAPLEEVVNRNPAFYLGLLLLAADYGQLGLMEKADWTISEALIQNPALSLETELRAAPYRQEDRRLRFEEGLRKAGLAE